MADQKTQQANPDRLPANFDFSKPVQVNPDRLPADFDFQQDFNRRGDNNPGGFLAEKPISFGGQFADKLLTDAANLIPGLWNLPGRMAHHPLDTSVDLVKGIGGAVVDPVFDALEGNYGRSAAGLVELGAPSILGKGVGRALEAGAGPMAELGGRVTKYDRMFDARPGKAILEETSGFTPKTVAQELQAKGAQLSNELTAKANQATGTADLRPAGALVKGRIQQARGAGAVETAGELQPMLNYVSGEAPKGFGGNTYQIARRATAANPNPAPRTMISPFQTPKQALDMRRAFPDEFRVRYKGEPAGVIEETGREVNRALSDQVKATVPGATELDPRLHDIIAAEKPMESTSRNAGLFQRSAARFAAHTGALASTIAGAHYFGPLGALAGLLIPEALVSPTAQIGAARAMQFGGRALQKPLVTIPATLGGKAASQFDQRR